MLRLPVDSTDIVAVGYDPKERVLEIEFKEQRLYQYMDVEPEVHQRLMAAESHGEYFDAYIHGRYRYKRVNQKQATAEQPTALAFVTGNLDKFAELQAACKPFGILVEQLELPVDELQAYESQRIAVQKAKHAYKLAKRPVIVQDSYWNIVALHGFPGAYMSYVTKWLGAAEFLALLAGKKDRTICFTETAVYFDGKRIKVFAQDTWGRIIDEPRGKGLAIDQIVVLDGRSQTIAELQHGGGMVNEVGTGIWHDFAKWYHLQRRIGKA